VLEPRRCSPAQKALNFAEWPPADREAWLTAQADGGLLGDGGAASHLSLRTREDLTRRYAYFLYSRREHGGLPVDEGPAAAVTEESILAYLDYLQPRLSAVTVAQSLYKVGRVASLIAPQRDWAWLQRIVRRLGLRAKPQSKRPRVVEITDLRRLGLDLMTRAEVHTHATPLSRARLYRDGLMIALLATDPVRRANVTGLEIGRSLVKDGSTWSIDLPARETKARRPHLALLPDWLGARIDRYVDHFRPIFRNSAATRRLWLSRRGRPLDDSSIYQIVAGRTQEAFGKPVGPHLFRVCLATSTAVHHGAQMGLAMIILDHLHSEVTERSYNQANMIDAVRSYQDLMLGD